MTQVRAWFIPTVSNNDLVCEISGTVVVAFRGTGNDSIAITWVIDDPQSSRYLSKSGLALPWRYIAYLLPDPDGKAEFATIDSDPAERYIPLEVELERLPKSILLSLSHSHSTLLLLFRPFLFGFVFHN